MSGAEYQTMIEYMKDILRTRDSLMMICKNPLAFEKFKIDVRVTNLTDTVTKLKNLIRESSGGEYDISFEPIQCECGESYGYFVISPRRDHLQVFIFNKEYELLPSIVDFPSFENCSYSFPIHFICTECDIFYTVNIRNKFMLPNTKENEEDIVNE